MHLPQPPRLCTLQVFALALLTGACSGVPPVSPPPAADLGIAVRDALGDESEAHWFEAAADLDGDGRDERLAYVAGPMVCGTGGCPLFVFTSAPQAASGWRLVSRTSVVRPPVRLAPRRSLGWWNLVVRVAGGGVPMQDAELAFDGRTYPLNPSVLPHVADAVALPVLIPEFASFRDGRLLPPAAWGDRRLPVAATVRGYAMHTEDAEELRAVVMMRLIDRFAATQGIGVSSAERDDYIRSVDAELRARGVALPASTSAEDRAERERVAVLFVRQWKIHQALFTRFGGRVGRQQGGPEPLDALRTLAEQAAASGDLAFRNGALETAFWRYYRDDAIHSFYPPDVAARVFDRPPWQATP